MTENENDPRFIELASVFVSAYVSNNNVGSSDLANLIRDVHTALQQTGNGGSQPEPEPQEPAVPIKKSVRPDAIVCLEDGKSFKSLKRHLRTDHNLSPEEYRSKWGLPRDYPMVTSDYAASRSELARKMGLGQKRPASSSSETGSSASGGAAKRGGGRGRKKAEAHG